MKIEIKIVPDGLDPAKEIMDGIPVDKMQDACPIATQDPQINDENRNIAIAEYKYGPASNPDERCGNCSAFNISDYMKDCLGDDSGEIGYCQLLKFMCSAQNVCSSWAEGGPITAV